MTINNKISTKDLIKMHQYPTKQFSLPGTKKLIPSNPEEENLKILESLKLMKTHLEEIRVQRSQHRSKAIWLPDKQIVKITKLVGKILPQFGFMENGEIFLSPEESLFLMEMNKLEILWNQVPFSIEQAYVVFCNNEQKLAKYRCFKELANNQYRLKNEKQSGKHSYTETDTNTNTEDDNVVKKLKIDLSESNINDQNQTLYDRLKKNGPSTFNLEKNYSTFKMHLPSNKNKNKNNDIQLITNNSNENEFSSKVVSQNDSCILTAFSGNENVALYQFHKVDLENK